MSKINGIIQADLDKAAELMEENAKEEAKTILERLLSENPSHEEIYRTAILIYWWGAMYPEIKELFKRYKERTGKALKADISLVEVEKRLELSKKKRSDDVRKVKIFKKIAWWFYAIVKIETSEQGICFKMISSRSYFYKWTEVKQVVLRRIEGAEQISVLAGPGTRDLAIQTTDGRRYRMVISQDDQSQSLLVEIRNHIKIQKGPTKKESSLIAILAAIFIFLIMFIGIKAGWAKEEIGLAVLFIAGLYYFFHRRF